MTETTVHSSDQLIARAITIAREGRKKTVAVAAAQDVDVIGAVAQAQQDGFVDGILVGDATQIHNLAREHRIDIDNLKVVDEADVNQAAHHAVRLASEKKADVIMKGFLPTSTLLKVVLDKQYGLRSENTLSHCAVLGIPGYHKLLNLTDGGMVVKPDRQQKYQILENAVVVARALGLSPVKVAVSGNVNKASEKSRHPSGDIEHLIKLVRAKLADVIIDGPMTLDAATSAKAAKLYDISGPVAADADIFLVDSIEECNIIAKSLIQFAKAIFAGVIVGAKVPVSLVSRTDTIKNKKASLAIACLLADYYSQSGGRAKGER
ncbi:MAG TPA: phosphate acyltransferase [Candidatus Deferrimicrobium sp.]|nr:phosphate acyltransferase [Candidatus Deferrimicrobium sp.]